MGGFPIRGVVPALLTPFDHRGDPDIDLLVAEVQELECAGMQAFCVGGVVAETVGSAPDEYRHICAAVTGATSKPVIAVIYPDSVREALDLAEAAIGAGASALLVAQPHYLFQPDANGLEELFAALRRAVEIPLGVSNSVPSAPLDLARLQRLLDTGLVDAVHETGSDAHLLADLLAASPRPPVLAGIESLMLVALVLGAEAIIGSIAAVFPQDCLALYDATQRGEFDRARAVHERLLRLWRALSHPAEFHARLKLACAAQGRPVGSPRSPYDWLSESSEGEIRRVLAAEGKI